MEDRKAIYFGSLEKHAETILSNHSFVTTSNSLINDKENKNVALSMEKEVLELSETSKAAQEKHYELLQRVEEEHRSKNIIVPTSIQDVIHQLRLHRQPGTLFGERPADRRDRLKKLLVQIQQKKQQEQLLKNISLATSGNISIEKKEKSIKQIQEQHFYIPIVNPNLKKARYFFCNDSFEKTKYRLLKNNIYYIKQFGKKANDGKPEEEDNEMIDFDITFNSTSYVGKLYNNYKHLIIDSSQLGCSRPISSVRFSPNSKYIATGSWAGMVKIWDAIACNELYSFTEGELHTERITSIDWNPMFLTENDSNQTNVALCSASVDCTGKVWSIDNHTNKKKIVSILKGHTARLGNIRFHPSGKFIGTTSYDHSWRLWDLEYTKGQELLLQEGHYEEVNAISFHPDGSLVATGDLIGNGRLWDLRSGKSILPLQGHSKQILSMDFQKDHYMLASSSVDHTIRIWDLRYKKNLYTIPAHSSLVPDIRFSRHTAELLVSCSYDGSIKIWNTRNWQLIQELKGHEGKIMSVDISASDDKAIVTAGYDRTFKIWRHEEEF